MDEPNLLFNIRVFEGVGLARVSDFGLDRRLRIIRSGTCSGKTKGDTIIVRSLRSMNTLGVRNRNFTRFLRPTTTNQSHNRNDVCQLNANLRLFNYPY